MKYYWLVNALAVSALLSCTSESTLRPVSSRRYPVYFISQDPGQTDLWVDSVFIRKIDKMFPKQQNIFQKDTIGFTLASVDDGVDTLSLTLMDSILYQRRFVAGRSYGVKVVRQTDQLFKVLINSEELITFNIPPHYDNVKVVKIYGAIYIYLCIGLC